ncbi:MAG: radical SAM protein [Clostridia bacterium BRH_c25]|nr:MAG: radical SAM protein [Clostridia bacterium BRH_c25]
MKYEGSIYRPPSEAQSLIIQATIGCSHNKCTFCSMYKDKKFRIRDVEEVLADIEDGRRHYRSVDRVFLADGNALAMKTEDLKRILLKISEIMPECERVGIYSSPKDILRKSDEELKELKRLGLGIAYMGLESGSDEILRNIRKGVTSLEMIEAGKKLISSGIKLSMTLISGLGGKAQWKEHALESVKVINEIDPHYLGLLTLLIEPGTDMEQQLEKGEFELLNPREVIEETRLLIEKLNLNNCVFRSNHASNYLALAGTLPQDKQRLLQEIEKAMNYEYGYKDEYFRRL